MKILGSIKEDITRRVEGQEGMVLGMALIFTVLLVTVATGFISLTTNEIRMAEQQNDSLQSFFIAEAGVEKAIYELYSDDTYSGESNVSIGGGYYTVVCEDNSDDGNIPVGETWITGTGYVTGNSSSSKREIRVIVESPDANISVNGALSAGGDVTVSGSANIESSETGVAGIVVPAGSSVNEIGAGSVTGDPDVDDTGSAPDFETVFGMTQSEMESISTVYVNPAKNEPDPCTGVIWIQGDAQFTTNGWYGEGILIVEGNLDMTGGEFHGVIYVLGGSTVDTDVAGNIDIYGALITEGEASFAGVSELTYSQEDVENAAELLPYHVLSWEERPGS